MTNKNKIKIIIIMKMAERVSVHSAHFARTACTSGGSSSGQGAMHTSQGRGFRADFPVCGCSMSLMTAGGFRVHGPLSNCCGGSEMSPCLQGPVSSARSSENSGIPPVQHLPLELLFSSELGGSLFCHSIIPPRIIGRSRWYIHSQHLLDLTNASAEHGGRSLLRALTAFTNCILQGDVPHSVKAVFFRATLISLRKKEGGYARLR